jgi:hypothetical protein
MGHMSPGEQQEAFTAFLMSFRWCVTKLFLNMKLELPFTQ